MTGDEQIELFAGNIMKKSARISACETYRWTLSRIWGTAPHLCWIMLNPSTADHEVDDPTINRVIHFTKSWGYNGFTVVNLYPFRSSQPPDCKKWATHEGEDDAKKVRDALRVNAPIVKKHAKAAAMVVAAWGGNAWDEKLVETIVQEIIGGEEPFHDIYCLGTTNDGAPKHPMARGLHRVPDDQQPVLWRSV